MRNWVFAMTAFLFPLVPGTPSGIAGTVSPEGGGHLTPAAVFGGNQLDDAAHGEGRFGEATPNNCTLFERIGRDAPSTGRIARLAGDGTKTYLGTGETLIREDVVVSAAHLVMELAAPRSPGGHLVFEVYEPSDKGCRTNSYRIEDYRALTSTPSSPPCAHLDIALFRLDAPVTSYRPLKIAPIDLVEAFRAGRVAATKIGFANHPSTDFGRDWSIVTANAMPLAVRDPSCRNANLFAYEGDAWSGESGAVFRIDGMMVGLHLRGYDSELATFSPARANIGAVVGAEARRLLLHEIGRLGDSGTPR